MASTSDLIKNTETPSSGQVPKNTSQGSQSLSGKGPTRQEIDDESIVETEITNKEPLPDNVLLEVHHFRQRYHWDCGLACILMLLPLDKRTYFLDNFQQICQEEAFGTSAWTIDLCYLLKRFGIKHKMYTSLIGVNENYQNYTYYQHCLHMDRSRVLRRFKEAEANGITVREGTLTTTALRCHLAKHGPVIVLVDAGLLTCDLCKHNKLKSEFRRCFGGNFKGHYVLLVGYSTFGKNDVKILYHDPDLKPSLCALSIRTLNEARFASGTDNDVILIYNYSSHRINSYS